MIVFVTNCVSLVLVPCKPITAGQTIGNHTNVETVLGGTFELFGGKEAHFVYKPKKKSHTRRASSYKQFIKAASLNYFKRRIV